MTPEYVIGFANQAQVILYMCELCGQISDGHWENSKPYDHWKIPCVAGCVGPKFSTESSLPSSFSLSFIILA